MATRSMTLFAPSWRVLADVLDYLRESTPQSGSQIETDCNEMLTRLADDCKRKAKVLRDGQSLIEAGAAPETDEEEKEY